MDTDLSPGPSTGPSTGPTFDLDAVRSCFPALERGVAHFDGPGGSQVPRQVAEAVAATLVAGVSNRGSVTAAERVADATVVGARAAMGDLLGCDPRGVVFGRSMTQLTMELARTLAQDWGPDDEVVVSRLDHDANIRPWVLAASAVGARVRWLELDPDSGELVHDPGAIGARTRLVAVTAASNLLGTRPDLGPLADAAHAAGALLFVDGVHLTPHAAVDVAGLGADFYACSPYKFFGPHLGVLAASPALLERLHPAKLLPSTDEVPERFELGTLPYELLAGVTAAVDFIAGLAPGATDPSGADPGRRDRLLASMAHVEAHEDGLLERLLSGLADDPRVRVHGHPAHRTPTVLFSVDGVEPRRVHEALAAVGVNAPAGSFYALEASRRLGLGDGGAVRAGLAPYTSEQDVDRLLSALADVH